MTDKDKQIKDLRWIADRLMDVINNESDPNVTQFCKVETKGRAIRWYKEEKVRRINDLTLDERRYAELMLDKGIDVEAVRGAILTQREMSVKGTL